MKLWFGSAKEVRLKSGEPAISYTEHNFAPEIAKKVFAEARQEGLGIIKAAKLAVKCGHNTVEWIVRRK